MRQRHEYDTRRLRAQPESTSTHQVCLYRDYAYIDRTSKTVKLGKVNRIILSGQHGHKDYRLPVQYDHEKKELLTVILSPYELVEVPEAQPEDDIQRDEDGSQKYREGRGVITIPFTDIFTHVNLTYNDSHFCLPADEVEVLRNKADRLVRPSTSRTQPRARRERQQVREQEAFDGMVRVNIPPDETAEAMGLRRSRRTTRTGLDPLTF